MAKSNAREPDTVSGLAAERADTELSPEDSEAILAPCEEVFRRSRSYVHADEPAGIFNHLG